MIFSLSSIPYHFDPHQPDKIPARISWAGWQHIKGIIIEAVSVTLGANANIDVIRGSPVAMDFWLEQKNADIRCSFDRFKKTEDHQTKKLTKSKIRTVKNITLKIVMKPS